MKDTNRWVGATLLVSALFVLSASIRYAQADPERASSEVTIADVQVRLSDHGPVVLLRAEGKVIPIFVDDTGASASPRARCCSPSAPASRCRARCRRGRRSCSSRATRAAGRWSTS